MKSCFAPARSGSFPHSQLKLFSSPHSVCANFYLCNCPPLVYSYAAFFRLRAPCLVGSVFQARPLLFGILSAGVNFQSLAIHACPHCRHLAVCLATFIRCSSPPTDCRLMIPSAPPGKFLLLPNVKNIFRWSMAFLQWVPVLKLQQDGLDPYFVLADERSTPVAGVPSSHFLAADRLEHNVCNKARTGIAGGRFFKACDFLIVICTTLGSGVILFLDS